MRLFFKRLLTIWFLFFTLSSSVAWAVSAHADSGGDSVHASDGNLPDNPLTWGDDGCQDRCCHASAHFIGLITSHALFIAPAVTDTAGFSEQRPLSFSLSPPFHPPIA